MNEKTQEGSRRIRETRLPEKFPSAGNVEGCATR